MLLLKEKQYLRSTCLWKEVELLSGDTDTQCIILNSSGVHSVLLLTNLHISCGRFMVSTHLQARKVKPVCSVTHTLCIFSLFSQGNAAYMTLLSLSIHLLCANHKPI